MAELTAQDWYQQFAGRAGEQEGIDYWNNVIQTQGYDKALEGFKSSLQNPDNTIKALGSGYYDVGYATGAPEWQQGQAINPKGYVFNDTNFTGGSFASLDPRLNPFNTTSPAPQTGLIGAEQALRSGLGAATSAIEQGTGQAIGDLQKGVDLFSDYSDSGKNALALLGAYSGAQGNEKQQAAFDNFTKSPGQQYLVDQGNKNTLQNAAAIGGLGGGNVRQELMKQGQGYAQQDFSNQYNRLAQLAGQGLNAAGSQAGLYGSMGNINNAAGQSVANMAYGTGQNLASGRTMAGNAIADNLSSSSALLSSLNANQGAGISDLIGSQGSQLASLLSGAGTATGASADNLATILANLSTGAASQSAALPAVGQSQGILGGIGSLAGGIGTALEAYKSIG